MSEMFEGTTNMVGCVGSQTPRRMPSTRDHVDRQLRQMRAGTIVATRARPVHLWL